MLSSAVSDSLRWGDEIPVQPFAFGDGPTTDSSFAVDLEVDGVRVEYLLDLRPEHVTYEGLFHYPEGRRRRVFERERVAGQNGTVPSHRLILQRGLGRLSGARAQLSERVLALTIMRRFDDPLISAVSDQIGALQPLSVSRLPRADWWATGPTDFFLDAEPSAKRDRALALLQLADLGVSDVVYDDRQVRISGGSLLVGPVPRLVHEAGGERRELEMRDESHGTWAWFLLIGSVLTALDHGQVMLFDEIDASLHPLLTARLVELFTDPDSNPRGAQLVFTSHDTHLLDQLNRDEIWFTEKNEGGATRLGSLAEFNGSRVRRRARVEASYLSGRYGALPDLSQAGPLRASRTRPSQAMPR